MKKVLLLILLLIFPNVLNALEIEKVYSDAEIEVGGALKVRTLIKVSNNDSDLKYNIFIKDTSLNNFTGRDEDFKSSSIYNASYIEVKKVGYLKDINSFESFYSENFDNENIELINEVNSKEENGYYIINLNSDEKEVVYYIEYILTNVLVEHNDSAELYYKYFSNFDYDIKEVKILTRLPHTSKLFKVWAHGSNNWNVSKDITAGFVMLEKTNFTKQDNIDLRILFDKELFAININKDKKTNMNAIPIIEKIEEERMDNTNISSLLKHLFIALGTLLLVSILGFIFYKLKKKEIKK